MKSPVNTATETEVSMRTSLLLLFKMSAGFSRIQPDSLFSGPSCVNKLGYTHPEHCQTQDKES
jgi:hypothetical protein